jgi:hypothetical protein
MFHAALVTAVCLCADPTSPDVSAWSKDLDTTRAVLTVDFSRNKLATRCVEILDELRPHATSDGGDLVSMLLQPNDNMGDFGFWSTDAADSLNALGWPDFGQDFP